MTERDSDKTECRHCKKFYKQPNQKHRQIYDTKLQKWVEMCVRCGMIELAEKQ